MAASEILPGLAEDLELILGASREAGLIAMRYFGDRNPNEVWTKQGDSPVSEADFAVDSFLKDALLAARPDYGWLSEETEDSKGRLKDRMSATRTFVVDPIDGTRGFISGQKQWCISIAVVENERPIAGVLECPAICRSFSASIETSAVLNGQAIRKLERTSLKSVTGSRKLNALLEEKFAGELEVHAFIPSLAYRIAMVANGEIDAALARPGAHDWDLAAAEVILEQSGGKLTDISGNMRRYNQHSPRSGSLLASGISNHARLLELAKSGGFLH